MNSIKNKKNIVILLLIGIVIICCAFALIRFINIIAERENSIKWPAMGSDKWNTMVKLDDRSGPEWQYIYKGEEFEKTDQFDKAAEQYDKALNIAKNGVFEFAVRQSLARAYEMNKQYENALQQLDWLIARQPRTEVLNQLKERKIKIQKMIKEAYNNQ